MADTNTQAIRIAMHRSQSINLDNGNTLTNRLACDQTDRGSGCSTESSSACSSTPNLTAYISLEDGGSDIQLSNEARRRTFERRRCFELRKTNTERWFMRFYFFLSLIAITALIRVIVYPLPDVGSENFICPLSGKKCTTMDLENETIQVCTGAVSQAKECYRIDPIPCPFDDEPFGA